MRMRAAILSRQGDPTVLKIQSNFPIPETSVGHEVLIRVKAIAISSADLMTRRGFNAGPVIVPPQILGSECVGVVEAVFADLQRPDSQVTETRSGQDGAKYKAGDVVIALMGGMGRMFNGCYSELVALPPVCLSAPLTISDPPSFSLMPNYSPQALPSFELLAAIPGAYLAAYGILHKSLQIDPTDTLLVQGGSSAVGMAVASLAKGIFGVSKIVGTTRNKGKVPKMKIGGYDTVIVLQPGDVQSLVPIDLAEKIKKEGGEPTGFKAIVELIGATNMAVSFSCANLSGGSRICMAGMLAGAYHFKEPFSPMGIPPGVFLTGYSSSDKAHLSPLATIFEAVLTAKIKITPDKVFSFEDIVKAHEYCESGAVRESAATIMPIKSNGS